MKSPGLFLIRTFAATLALTASVALPLSAQNEILITGTVRDAVTGARVADAKVSVIPGNRSVVTRADGSYRVPVDSIARELRVTAVGFIPVSRPVSLNLKASAVIDFELTPSVRQLNQVVTLGTRVHERTAAQSPVPVDVLSSEMLESSGAMETWQQLERLVPSIFGPHIPLGDNGTRPVTLRGLAPHHTLILVNGKRRHPQATLLAGPSVANKSFTDLNAIPASAIDHIEVLRDGASAQYGSDAIGGVVNLVLKSGEHRNLRTTVGQVFSSEGGRTHHDGRLFSSDGTWGVLTRRGAYLTLAGEYRDRMGTNRAYPDQRPQYFDGDPRNDEPPRVSGYLGDAAVKATSFFLTGAAPLNSTTELYASGGWAYKDNLAPDAFFRRPLDSATVRAIYPDGFRPRIESRIGDASALVGVRGSLSGWRWDISSGWGDNRVSYDVDHSNNASLGAASPTNFYAGRVSAQQWTTNFDVSRELMIRSFPLTVSGGGELRLDRYQIRAGDPDSWREGGVRILDGPQEGSVAPAGAQGLAGFRPIDEVSAHRSNTALYIEAEGRPLHRLLVQSAVRAERYSDFGSTSDAKLAGRMELLNGLALRGSLSTGFRAPSLTEQYYARSSTTYRQIGGVGTFLTSRIFPVSSAEARLIGATKLRAESSVNHSVGLLVNRPSLPVVTADLYQIRIDHLIGVTGIVSDTSVIRLFREHGMPGISGGSYFTNNLNTRTRGVDIMASHPILVTRATVVRLFGGFNYNKTLVTHVEEQSSEPTEVRRQLFNRTSRAIIEQGQPRRTTLVALDYSAGPLGLNVNNQRSGPTAQLDQRPAEAGGKDQIVAPKWVTDMRASYKLRSRLEVAVSAVNVFDVYPDEWWDFKYGVESKAFSNQGIGRYPGALFAAGQNGRTLYLQLAYR